MKDFLTINRNRIRAPWTRTINKKSITINDDQGHILVRMQIYDVPEAGEISILMESAPDLLNLALRLKKDLVEQAQENLSLRAEITGLKHYIKTLEAALKRYQDNYPMP